MTDHTRPDQGKLLPFQLDGTPLRVLPATGDHPDLFAATDLCTMLGHSDPSAAVRDHLDLDEYQNVDLVSAGRPDSDSHSGTLTATPGHGPQQLLMVTESGAWALLITSRLPHARRIRKWITSEVLPSIRRTGLYATDDTMRWLLTLDQAAYDLVSVEFTLHNARLARIAGNRKREATLHEQARQLAWAASDRVRAGAPDALRTELGGTGIAQTGQGNGRMTG